MRLIPDSNTQGPRFLILRLKTKDFMCCFSAISHISEAFLLAKTVHFFDKVFTSSPEVENFFKLPRENLNPVSLKERYIS